MRLLTASQNRACHLRLLNTADEPVRLWSGQTVTVLQRAYETRPYRDRHLETEALGEATRAHSELNRRAGLVPPRPLKREHEP